MANAGAVVLKFWLHIDKDEQERRFKERQADPLKLPDNHPARHGVTGCFPHSAVEDNG